MIEGDIRTFLLSFTSVSGVFLTKIYTGNIPEGVSTPMACIYRIADNTGHVDEIEILTIQVSNFATVYSDVVTQSELLNVRLKGYIGKMGNTQIVSVMAGNSNRLYDTTLKRWMSTRDYFLVLR